MGLSTDLISQFVKNTNDSEKKKEEIVVYGTIVSDGERNYVQIDGSSELTPINTTVETNVGDRVLVTVKNHTATVTGNASDPAVGTKRAGNIESSIKQTADSISIAVKNEVDKLSASLDVTVDGIRTEVTNKISGLESSISKIEQTANSISSTVETHYDELTTFKGTVNGELSGVKSSISKIEQTASSITTRVENVESTNESFSEFKQTIEGFSFMGKGGTVKISGGDITLTGSIKFTDLEDSIQSTINTASSKASEASTAVSNLTTSVNNNTYNVGQALTKAENAYAAAEAARQLANSVQLPSYLKSTYIDFSTVMSPKIIGGQLYAVGQTAWTSMDSDGLRIYTGGIAQPKIELVNYVSNYTELLLGAGTKIGSTTMGRFSILKQSDKVVLRYYSGINEFLSCALVLYDNGKIELRRDYADTNYPSRTTKLTLIEGI